MSVLFKKSVPGAKSRVSRTRQPPAHLPFKEKGKSNLDWTPASSGAAQKSTHVPYDHDADGAAVNPAESPASASMIAAAEETAKTARQRADAHAARASAAAGVVVRKLRTKLRSDVSLMFRRDSA